MEKLKKFDEKKLAEARNIVEVGMEILYDNMLDYAYEVYKKQWLESHSGPEFQDQMYACKDEFQDNEWRDFDWTKDVFGDEFDELKCLLECLGGRENW